jgi:hypothetical protein
MIILIALNSRVFPPINSYVTLQVSIEGSLLALEDLRYNFSEFKRFS